MSKRVVRATHCRTNDVVSLFKATIYIFIVRRLGSVRSVSYSNFLFKTNYLNILQNLSGFNRLDTNSNLIQTVLT